MRKYLSILFFVVFVVLGLLFTKNTANAGYFSIEQYDVDIDINKDSSFKVRETIQYRFSGEFHRVNRGITLRDFEAEEFCQNSSTSQCGGFDHITLLGVYDSQERLVPNEELSIEEVDKGYGEELEIIWEFASDGEYFNSDEFTWIIEYEVNGGIGFFDDYDLFYWDVFPPYRSVEIEKGSMTISFPGDIEFTDEKFQVLRDYYEFEYTRSYNDNNNTLALQTEDLPRSEPFTVMVKMPKEILLQPASLKLDLRPKDQDITIDGEKIYRIKEDDTITGIVPGERNIKFEASGYHSKEFDLDFAEGEEKELTVQLEMTLLEKVKYAAIVLGNVLGCGGGVVLIFLVILNYYRKGRDIGGRKTIVPWFKPPEGISPVLVGSIKDEKVHLKDITSTIINAAVRGFIRIEEIGKKKYKLVKLKEFEQGESMKGKRVNYETLDKSEVKILKDIFGSKKVVKTSELKNKFYIKVPKINKTIYEEMVQKGYFEKNPDKVRKKHIGIGVGMLVLGVVLTFFLWMIINFTCGPALAVAGIVKIIFANFMPAKTEKGTEVYEKCKGFRMFLHTAERFKMQDLTPQTFERFLPYAMVFGVEKQWAKNFEDIYTQPPNWYRGRDPWTTFNSIYLINSLSRMNSATSRTLASSPRSSGGSFSGGGWSGGGGFSGGFSGGGGGGGSVGAS